MSYSTCSLNPVENEAVVAAALKEFKGKIRFVKAELPGFKFQQGFKSWKFLNLKSKAKLETKGEQDSFFDEFV